MRRIEAKERGSVDQQRSAIPREIVLNLLNSATLGRRKKERKDTHSPRATQSRRDVVVAAAGKYVDTRTHQW